MPLPPPLTEEQRRVALQKAAEARRKRAELKEQLKSGRTTLRELLERNDEVVGKMKVATVLESLPGVGRVRARKLMERLDISESRRMRGLGAKQKENLLQEFSRR
ncbi:MAG: integration host factor [Actinomycetota bacterium]|nr:integration host factor [Actinomycetota bacterium]